MMLGTWASRKNEWKNNELGRCVGEKHPQGLHKINKTLLRLASLHKNEIAQQRNRYIINKAQNLVKIFGFWASFI